MPEGDHRIVDDRWDLGPLELKPGAHVTFYATATDYQPQTGKSEPRSLTIISAEELQNRLADREKLVLAELERVLKMQRGCRAQLESLRARLAEQRRIGQPEVDLLQALQHNQREVDRALTSRGEGVPMHILALLADLENNRLSTDDIGQRMAALMDQLDRLGREHLSALGQELTAAAKTAQVAREEQGRAVPVDERLAAPLAVAGKHQDAVIAALEQMIGQLGQWDSYRRFLAEIGQLLRDQQALMQRTAEVGRRTLTQSLRDLAPADAEELKAAAERQLELGPAAGPHLAGNGPGRRRAAAERSRGRESDRRRPGPNPPPRDQPADAHGGRADPSRTRLARRRPNRNKSARICKTFSTCWRLGRRPATAEPTGEELARLEEDVERLRDPPAERPGRNPTARRVAAAAAPTDAE